MNCPSHLVTDVVDFDCQRPAGHSGKHCFENSTLNARIEWTDEEAARMEALIAKEQS